MSPDSDGDGVRLPARLVVASEPGTFRPCPPTSATAVGDAVGHGTALGTIETLGRSVPVTSAFAGRLAAVLASDGERLRVGQPVAWLHLDEAAG
ncbi:hypothetical protein PO878_06475 [Iamia majanohamensis]|uniref:Lipoyl-binding domain-containing protein n=1 Tax=Iamia majanohamensis TaxID=467976 RepID=A0AAE9YH36_9ACTN|nr:biotin/lipoyl-containing protein [Iamia majanohamensis]WCO68372.1 hypothetical protein PO878_06475 [Iamia majanohamensis]